MAANSASTAVVSGWGRTVDLVRRTFLKRQQQDRPGLVRRGIEPWGF